MKNLAIILVLLIVPFWSFSQGCADVDPNEKISIIGFIQPEYQYNFSEGGSNTFAFNRARLGVAGNIPYDFTYYAMMEFSPVFTGNPFLLDVFMTYGRYKWVKPSIGQFKAPFSLELQTPCHKLNTVYRSQAVLELASPLRDLGFMVFGGNDTTILKYQFAILNGAGMNNFDDNGGKDYVARVVFQPFKAQKILGVGGSYRYGTSAPKAEGVVSEDVHMRWGLEANLNYKNFTLQGEYIYGKDDGSYLTGGGCGGPGTVVEGSIERQGWYFTAMYMTRYRLQPVVKYEYMDSDMSADDAFKYITTLGVNYFFNDWTRLQANYMMVNAQSGEHPLNNQFILQFQVVF
jgi:phosphate-selective porin